MSAPPLISMFLQYSYNLVDSMFVAKINEQATDQVLPSMMIQLLRQGILLIPFMWIFNYIFKMRGIWISFPVTELIVCIIAGLFIRNHTDKTHYFNFR